MSARLRRGLAVLDVVGISLLVGLYIWRLHFTSPHAWMIFPIWLVASFVVHRDSPRSLGWRADNLWAASRQATVVFSALAVLLLIIGLSLGAPTRLLPHIFSLRHLWKYFAFCLLQQVALQSLLNNRLLAMLSNRWATSLLAGAIFGALHWPNPVLVPLTFLSGTAMAWLFARHRNIIPLAVGQAILGSMVWWAFPVRWHHFLRVGPGYYQPF